MDGANHSLLACRQIEHAVLLIRLHTYTHMYVHIYNTFSELSYLAPGLGLGLGFGLCLDLALGLGPVCPDETPAPALAMWNWTATVSCVGQRSRTDGVGVSLLVQLPGGSKVRRAAAADPFSKRYETK